MKVVLFGGFLGSGKTSLVMQAARHISADVAYRSSGDKPPAVVIIENEIGEVALDAGFLATGGYEVRNLFAGCICCTLAGNLLECFDEIVASERPDWLLIEATGMAYPEKIAEALRRYRGISPRVLTVVDAKRWPDLFEALEPLIVGQIRGADAILVNKTDGLFPAALVALRTTLTDLFPAKPVVSLSALDIVAPEIWRQLLP
jgi:Putative GTPases (G3E family)